MIAPDPQANAQSQPETTRQALSLSPVTDIYETLDALVVVMEMPGVDPANVDVEVENRTLQVAGRAVPRSFPDHTLVYAEYRDVDFARSFTLAGTVDSSKIEAVMADGVLRLNIPKAKPATHKITVKPA